MNKNMAQNEHQERIQMNMIQSDCSYFNTSYRDWYLGIINDMCVCVLANVCIYNIDNVHYCRVYVVAVIIIMCVFVCVCGARYL